MLAYGIPPEFRGGDPLFIFTAKRHRVSPEFIESRNCVPMAFTAESPPAQGQYRASTNRATLELQHLAVVKN